ncbi:DUF998 domain-containing protein [Paenibacillus sp. 1P07SE]|uniref:DUF998 domain-containing protein n=1 Tax=Paenibacillus sp. 1P07SE TaxID=3132209 RepID=UPI0039A5EC5D
MGHPRTTNALLLCGAFGSLLFMLVFLLDGATRPDYNPIYHPVSALSLGERGWIQTANFLIAGLLLTAFAIGIRRALRPGSGAVWGPFWLSLFGIGLFFSGVFPMDPMQNYPPGAPSGVLTDVSSAHLIHDVFGIVVFLSLPLACFAFARAFAKRARPWWAIYSLLTGLVTLVLFFYYGMAWENDSEAGGLLQRAMLMTGLVWMTLVALRLRKPA